MSVTPIRLLSFLALVLATALAWMWVDEHGRLRDAVWSPPAALAPGLAKPAALAASAASSNPTQYLAILERPVFAPDRRPPPPPAPPAPPDPMASIQIQGIFSGANAGILARVDGRFRRVKINELIGSWTLKGIEGREAIFGHGEETRRLRLAYARLDTVTPQNATATVPNSNPVAAGSMSPPQHVQDEMRERLRRRNEIRAARGLPPVTD